MYRFFAFGHCFLLLAFTSIINEKGSSRASADLLDGSAIFGEPVLVSESLALDPLDVSEEMREFVGAIGSAKPEIARYRKLVTKLENFGYFDENYDSTLTSSASDTFATKKGTQLDRAQ